MDWLMDLDCELKWNDAFDGPAKRIFCFLSEFSLDWLRTRNGMESLHWKEEEDEEQVEITNEMERFR